MLYYYIENRYILYQRLDTKLYANRHINFVLLSYIYDKDKIRFEWVDIIYDMSKARRSVSLIPFNPIRQPALWILPSLYKVWTVPLYGQAIPLNQAHYEQHRLRSNKYHFLSRWYEPDSNLRPLHPDKGVLLLSQICLVRYDKSN